MPILKLTQKVEKSSLTVKIASPVLDDLKRYAQYTNAGTNEIVQQALAYVFEKDSDFQRWKERQAAATVVPAKGKSAGLPVDKPVAMPSGKLPPSSGLAS